MKVTPQQADRFVDDLPPAIRAVLLYGPDQGMARERADKIIVACTGERHDPFRVVDLSADELKADPARLADEAAAFSMTGGRRAIAVENAADHLTALCGDILTTATGDTLIVLIAGELRPQSSLRRLFEKDKAAAAVACYPDTEGGRARLIETGLGAHGVAIEPDAVAFLAEHLGADRRLIRLEVEKLALYAGDGGRLTEADIRACIGSNGDFALDDVVFAAADGDQRAVESALRQAWQADTAPVAVIRSLQRHVQRLSVVTTQVARGTDVRQALRSLRPPVFWKQEQRFQAQARRWSPDRLAEALSRLVDAEVELKLGQAPDRSACARAIMSFTQSAARQTGS